MGILLPLPVISSAFLQDPAGSGSQNHRSRKDPFYKKSFYKGWPKGIEVEKLEFDVSFWKLFFVLFFQIVLILFSERKGYTAVKKCLKFVCLSKSIRNKLFYFSSFRYSDRTLLEFIAAQDSNLKSNFPAKISMVKNSTNRKRAIIFFIFLVF